jgi:hypothetical protein
VDDPPERRAVEVVRYEPGAATCTFETSTLWFETGATVDDLFRAASDALCSAKGFELYAPQKDGRLAAVQCRQASATPLAEACYTATHQATLPPRLYLLPSPPAVDLLALDPSLPLTVHYVGEGANDEGEVVTRYLAALTFARGGLPAVGGAQAGAITGALFGYRRAIVPVRGACARPPALV